jgi:hypothetical protein
MNYFLNSGTSTVFAGTTVPTYDSTKKVWVTDVGSFVDVTGKNYSIGSNDLTPLPTPVTVTPAQFLALWTPAELAAIQTLEATSPTVKNLFTVIATGAANIDMSQLSVKAAIRKTLFLLPVGIITAENQIARFAKILSGTPA